MIIDNLPSISLPVQSTDEIPIERGTTTNKVAVSGLMNGVLKTSDVVNSLTSTATDKPLSANMGKELANLGNVVSGTVSGQVNVETGTATAIGTIDLTKGTWFILACCNWGKNANGWRQIAFIGDGTEPARNSAVTANGLENKEVYQQLNYIISVSTNTTFTVYGRQNSGVALTAMPNIQAIRIGL